MNWKRLSIGLGVVLGIIVLFVITAPVLFKKQIQAAVQDVTKEFITTPVQFQDLTVSFFTHFPHLSVSLEKLSVEAPEEFNGLKTVETKSIDLGIDISSLFGNQIKFTRLYVHEGKFNLVTDSLGHFSFDIFKPSDKKEASGSFALSLEQIQVHNTRVVYQDEVSKIKITTDNTNIYGKVLVTDSFIDFDTDADIQSVFFGLDKTAYVDHKPLKGKISTRVMLDPVSVVFRENKVTLGQLPLEVAGKVNVLEKGIDFDLNVAAKKVSLVHLFSLVPKPYEKWYDGMTFNGTSDIDLTFKGMMQDSVSNPDLHLKVGITEGRIAAKAFENQPLQNLNTYLTVALPQLNPDSLTVNISSFDFTLGNGFAQGKAIYRFPATIDAQLKSQLNVTQLWQTLAISGMQLKGDAVIDGWVKGTYTEKNTRTKTGKRISTIATVPQFNVNMQWNNGYFQWVNMPVPVDKLAFDLHAVNTDGNYKNTQIKLTNIAAHAGKNYVKGHMNVANLNNFDTDTHLQAFVDLAAIKDIVPVKDIEMAGQLTIDTKAKGRLDWDRQRIPKTMSVVKWKNGYLKYANLPELPLEKINLETHISSPKGSLNDLRVKVLPISFVLANEPFTLDASLFNFNNLSFNVSTKGNLNLGNLYKLFAIEGLSVNGSIQTDVRVKGNNGGNDASSIRNHGFVLLRNILIQSDYFPHPFIFKKGKFTFFRDKMKMENIEMLYAKQSFILNGDLENYINYFLTPHATLKGNLAVSSEFIDVNSFMFGNTKPVSATSSSKGNAATGVVMIPDKINFELSATAQKVKFNDLMLNDLSGVLKVYDKKLELHEAKFGLIETPFFLNGTYQPLTTKHALFSFDLKAEHFDIQKAYKQLALFREMAPAAEKAFGQVSVKYQLEGVLNKDMFPNMKSIKGGGDLMLENIQFNGFKLFNQVAQETKTDALHDAGVKNVTVKTHIADNVITIERTKFKIAGFRPRVEGQVTLDGKLNLGMRLGLPPFGIIGIPMTIKGTSDDFKINLGKYKEEALTEDDEEYEEYKKSIDTLPPL